MRPIRLPAAPGGFFFIYTYGMRRGMYAWGALAALGVAAASLWLMRPALGAAPESRVLPGSNPLEVALGRPPLPPAQGAALQALALGDPGTVARPYSKDMEHKGPMCEAPLSAQDERALAQELAAARAAAATLDTPAKAKAAGYIQASPELPGVGTHLINWTLIAQPFDPAQPSMILFATIGGVEKLVGFSYYVQSDTEPTGFTGPSDTWHRHKSLCIVNGWAMSEKQPKEKCRGEWLDGNDLWMSHVWVVPEFESPWGVFSTYNPTVCPDGTEPQCADLRPPGSVPGMEHAHH